MRKEEGQEEIKNKPDEKEELRGRLEECERQRAEYLAGWQRARADFMNYKKEEMKRVSEFIEYAKEEFLLHILLFLDSFALAEKRISDHIKNDENIRGFLQVGVQMKDFLKKHDVQEIKVLGEKFDPNFHEAVEEEYREGVESGIILEEIQKGYTIQGRLLRPAKVKVAK